jgi:hypothetical protein
MSTHIRQAGRRGLRPLAFGFALGMALMLWSVALAHADLAPTATTLSCTPESTEAGQPVHCTATVSGISSSSTGTVVFKSENGGEFSARSCDLGFGDKGIASCGVDYTAPITGQSSVRLHALYVGDEHNASSQDVFMLAIVGKGDGGKGDGGESGGEVIKAVHAKPKGARRHHGRRSRARHRSRTRR